ncbi:MAG: histidine phosphatase family protein [Bifidobacterium sp.]|nr:histidine phosphatase family protein [Bifidobacterium sp.]
MIDEVILQRHGRTAFNLARRLQGQIDVPLDIVGQWQADHAAYELADRLYWAKISHIARNPTLLAQPGEGAARRSDIEEYELAPAARRTLLVTSSPLFRARQTAHATADILGLPVATDAGLLERAFGQWEGLTREEIAERWPGAYDSWTAHRGGELAYGVESRHDVGERGAKALIRIVREHADDPTPTTLLAVSHGSWIVATVSTLLDMDVDDLNALGGMRNAFWTTMRVSRGADGLRWELEEFNEGPSLAAHVDWDNGPEALRHPGMPLWKPVRSGRA